MRIKKGRKAFLFAVLIGLPVGGVTHGQSVVMETASSLDGFVKLAAPAASGRTVVANPVPTGEPLSTLTDGRL